MMNSHTLRIIGLLAIIAVWIFFLSDMNSFFNASILNQLIPIILTFAILYFTFYFKGKAGKGSSGPSMPEPSEASLESGESTDEPLNEEPLEGEEEQN